MIMITPYLRSPVLCRILGSSCGIFCMYLTFKVESSFLCNQSMLFSFYTGFSCVWRHSALLTRRRLLTWWLPLLNSPEIESSQAGDSHWWASLKSDSRFEIVIRGSILSLHTFHHQNAFRDLSTSSALRKMRNRSFNICLIYEFIAHSVRKSWVRIFPNKIYAADFWPMRKIYFSTAFSELQARELIECFATRTRVSNMLRFKTAIERETDRWRKYKIY